MVSRTRLASEEQSCVNRGGEGDTRIRMARHGVRIGAARIRIARPGGRGNRMQALADAAAEKGRELTDCKARERRFAFGFELAGESAAQIAPDPRGFEQ